MRLPILIALALLAAAGTAAAMRLSGPDEPGREFPEPSRHGNRPAASSMNAPGPSGTEQGSQTQPHHGHHASDETDDATSRHPFDDTERWVALFDDPSREEWQMPARVVEALELRPGMNAADIGAGTGYFNRHLAGAVGPEGRVYACDIEPNMVAYMRERAEREETPNVIPVLAAADDPRLPPGELDLILIVNTYHHFDDRLQYFDRLEKALRPGGRIAVVDFVKREIPVGPGMEHKLERSQVIAEMEAAGYRLVSQPDFLPYQYFLIFKPR